MDLINFLIQREILYQKILIDKSLYFTKNITRRIIRIWGFNNDFGIIRYTFRG
jgi:hypothetical protein